MRLQHVAGSGTPPRALQERSFFALLAVVGAATAGCYQSGDDDGPGTIVEPCPDDDGDGHSCDDCDDGDPDVHPGVLDGGCCGADGRDQDCDGAVDEDEIECDVDLECAVDADRDGWFAGDDCNDSDPSIHPGAPDLLGTCFEGNGMDDDCDGLVDEGPEPGAHDDAPWRDPVSCDQDGDGWGQDLDCNDFAPAIHPEADDCCRNDGIDDDCDGVIDGSIYHECECVDDRDHDGWDAGSDCDDEDPSVNPGHDESCCRCGDEAWNCDFRDDDCDGQVDEGDEYCCDGF